VELCSVLGSGGRQCAVAELSSCTYSGGSPGSSRSKITSVGINVASNIVIVTCSWLSLGLKKIA